MAGFEPAGLQQMRSELRRIGKALTSSAMKEALTAGGEQIAVRAKQRAPTGPTGQLRRSIGVHDVDEKRARIGPAKEAFYGRWVEFGKHRKHRMAARPFMRPAIDGGKAAAIRAVSEGLRRFLLGRFG